MIKLYYLVIKLHLKIKKSNDDNADTFKCLFIFNRNIPIS